MHVWSEHVLRGSPKHLSLHFDRLRVSRDAIQNMDEYIRACEDAISSKTPFNVKIVAKKHGNLIQLVQDEGTLVSKITTLPDLLKAQGNCIPCSVWHAVPTTRQLCETKDDKKMWKPRVQGPKHLDLWLP